MRRDEDEQLRALGGLGSRRRRHHVAAMGATGK
jgi:hypothetical protein